MRKKRNYVSPNNPFVDFYIVQFGHEYCEPSHTFGPTLTHNYLFHYIVSGKGTFYHPHGSTDLFSGQGFLIPPDTICSYSADAQDPWEYYWIEFNGTQAKQVMKSIGFTDSQLSYMPQQAAVPSEIIELLTSIIETDSQRQYQLLGKVLLLFDALIHHSSRQTLQAKDEISNAYLRMAVNFIRDNYQQNISINDIADYCNLNKNYFTRLFKDELSMTPSQYLINYRLRKSTELLLDSDLSIKEISEAVGYSSQFSYSNAFKKHYQLSPFEWRTQRL